MGERLDAALATAGMPLDAILELVEEGETATAGVDFAFDAVGMCFPDVVVDGLIVGGEVYKTRGIRRRGDRQRRADGGVHRGGGVVAARAGGHRRRGVRAHPRDRAGDRVGDKGRGDPGPAAGGLQLRPRSRQPSGARLPSRRRALGAQRQTRGSRGRCGNTRASRALSGWPRSTSRWSGWHETDWILHPATSRRVVFGRSDCFPQLLAGAARLAPELELVVANSDLAYSPLMCQLRDDPRRRISTFAQAIGAVHYANGQSHEGSPKKATPRRSRHERRGDDEGQ